MILPEAEPETGPLAADRAHRAKVLHAARAYSAVMAEDVFFCGRTAGTVWELPELLRPRKADAADAASVHWSDARRGQSPGSSAKPDPSRAATVTGPDHEDLDLEVAVEAPRRAPRGRGIRGRKISPKLVHVQSHVGLRVSSPASTWAMLASELSVRELVIVGDAIVRIPRDRAGNLRPEQRLATTDQLRAAMAAGRRVGIEKLRAAIEQIRVGSASPLETEFRLDIIEAGLPEPALDVAVLDADGQLIGIADAAYAAYRLLIEVEGDHHRTEKEQWNRDIDKHARYVAAGWEVVRLTSAHIRGRHPRAVELVRNALRRHGWTGE